jgi:hypothetical protein
MSACEAPSLSNGRHTCAVAGSVREKCECFVTTERSWGGRPFALSWPPSATSAHFTKSSIRAGNSLLNTIRSGVTRLRIYTSITCSLNQRTNQNVICRYFYPFLQYRWTVSTPLLTLGKDISARN